MKGICLILFMTLGLCATAQNQVSDFRKIDSLLLAGAPQDAFQQIEKLENIYPGKELFTRLQIKKAEALISMAQLTEAEALLDKAEQDDVPSVLGLLHVNRGFLQYTKGRNDLALQELGVAQKIFQDAGTIDSYEGARCLSLTGLVYSAAGKYKQAESNQLMALQIRQRLFGDQSEEVAASYNDLGLVYGETNPDLALDFYEKALPIYQKIHGADHQKIAVVSTNIGMTYSRLELYGDATNNLETALAIWKKKYPQGHPNEALALLNLGQTYDKIGNRKAAREYFEKALVQFQSFYNGKHSDIAYAFNLLGSLKLEENDFDGALQNFQGALIANAPDFANQDILKNPAVDDYYNANVMLYSLQLKSKALEARHFGKTLKLDDLTLALTTLFACDSLIDEIRHHSTDETDKIALGGISNEVYGDGVRVAHEIGDLTWHSRPYQEAAFYFAEKSKSAVLLESIADSEAKSFAGIPATILEEEKNLKAEAAWIAQKLAQKPALEEEKKFRQQLFTIESKYNAFIKRLEHDFPNYFNLKYNAAHPTVADFQGTLDDHTAILSYFIAEEYKRVYLFVVTQRKFLIQSRTLPDNFDRLIKGLSNGVYYNYMEAFSQASGPLSDLLLPRLPRNINQVIIIPAGRLGTVPFEVLVTGKIREAAYEQVPFLVKQYAISYAFSANLLLQKQKSGSQKESPSIFLCAPVQFPEKDNLDELPGTDTEVNAIKNLFGGKSTLVKYKDANEAAVKSDQLAQYNYLHFATHGIVDETDPELSRIFLNMSPGEDGNLFSGEIYTMNLNADLAVLSACQTGLGKISKGEGVIGLSRALIYAGARNLIVSYWSVADASTAQLMTDFYEFLIKSGPQNFSEALRQSKLKMISAKKYAAPYYWAPFILIGN